MEADKLLEEAKGQFKAVMVTGFDEQGNLKVLASPDNAAVAHWILNRALFELNLYEKSLQAMQSEQQDGVTDLEAKELPEEA